MLRYSGSEARDGTLGAMAETIIFAQVTPVLRIFDIAKADEFYLDYLGFRVDWDHRLADYAPLYRQVSRGDLNLHLSEHYGDGTPGAKIRVAMRGIRAFHAELATKDYRFLWPDLETMPWNTLEFAVYDPFGNVIRFAEPIDSVTADNRA